MEDKITNISPRDKHIIACIWDFDKTLINGYMQAPLFEEYKINEKFFWDEVNRLPKLYAQKGVRVSPETVYLNHILSYVKNGIFTDLSNKKLFELGAKLKFCKGLPDFFEDLKNVVKSDVEFCKLDIKLEHYIISTGLTQMIKGSQIAKYADGIFGCEFIEEPYPPNFIKQSEFDLPLPTTNINQIGMIVDNTIKTRFIFEINKGTNINEKIDVNSSIQEQDRRIPIRNMIYIADGPSDVPVFSVVRKGGGKTFAVYTPESLASFEQNDSLLADKRIDAYGPADYSEGTATNKWLKMHIKKICERIVRDTEESIQKRIGKPPSHIHKDIKDTFSKPENPELF